MRHLELLKVSHQQLPKVFRVVNDLIDKVRFPVHLNPNMRRQGIMVTTEQRANLALLLQNVLDEGIQGDVVELGSYQGHSAVVLASVLAERMVQTPVHLFDDFKSVYGKDQNDRSILLKRFKDLGLPAPVVHEGDFKDTLEKQLPDKIRFVHIDCGNGDDPAEHARRLLLCLEAVYDRMPAGANGVLMDYHDPYLTINGWDANPGVKAACDRFFSTRKEVMRPMYGGEFSHAYFRKE